MNPMFNGVYSLLRVAAGAGAVLCVAHQITKSRERKHADERLAKVERLLAELREELPSAEAESPATGK